jgi:hypothetical protein
MNPIKLALVIAGALVTSTHCQGDQSDIFDEAILHCSKMSEEYSVLAMIDSIDERESEDSLSTSVNTRYLRVVRSVKKQRTRMDLVTIGLSTNSHIYESVLRLENGKSLIAFGIRPGQFQEGGRNGKRRFNTLAAFDLPSAPITDGSALFAGNNLYITDYPKRVDLKQVTEGNGDHVVTTTLPGNLTIGTFRFRRVEDVWLPTDIKWWMSKDGSKVDLNSSSLEPYKKWEHILSISSRWKKVDPHGFVPWHIKYSRGMESKKKRFDELLFTDWKFGDEIDVSLLDEKKFTSEEINKAFELEKWKVKFEDWKP